MAEEQEFNINFVDSLPDCYYMWNILAGDPNSVGKKVPVQGGKNLYYNIKTPIQLLLIAEYDTNYVTYPILETDGTTTNYNISLKNIASSNTPTTIQLPTDSSITTAYILFDDINSYITNNNGNCQYYTFGVTNPPSICIDLVGI